MHLEWCHPCLVMSILAQAFYVSRGRKSPVGSRGDSSSSPPVVTYVSHLYFGLWFTQGANFTVVILWFPCCFHWGLLPMEVCRHQEFTFFSFFKVKSGRPRSVSTQRRDIPRGVTGWNLLTSKCVREASLPSTISCHEMGSPSLPCDTFPAWLALPLTFHISVFVGSVMGP